MESAIIAAILITIAFFSINFNYLNQQSLISNFEHIDLPTSDQLVIIEIDNESIKHFDKWPWPRYVYADLLNSLAKSNPEIVVFDIDFSTKSNMYHDLLFSNAIKEVPFSVVLSTTIVDAKKTENGDIEYVENVPIDALKKYALLASANALVDPSGYIFKYATFSDNGRPSIGAILANRPNVSTEPIQIDYAIDPGYIKRFSFKDVIEGNFTEADFKDKKVLVGSTSIELGDMYTLPKYNRVPGVFVHALGYESIAAENHLTHSSNQISFFIALILLLILTFFHNDKKLVLTISINLIAFAVVFMTNIILHHYYFVIFPVAIIYISIAISTTIQIVQNIRYRAHILLLEKNKNNYNKALINQVIKENTNGIIITSLEGKILVANKKACNIYSITAKNIKHNESIFMFIPESRELFHNVNIL
ncbi:MAG: CHASE2 domain-containing protein [Rhizobiales bacterium]|nr:CHASE2 domain-containing protein [Hyphomicrobiales bacterium]